MTDDLAQQLADLERALTDRVEIWREILDPDGTVIARIYRGSFYRPRGSQESEPPSRKGEQHHE